MRISSREIWNGLPAEDRLALVAGKHPEYVALHRIKVEAIGDAAFEDFLTDYVINAGVGIVRPVDA
jgi:hypothetical protein